MRTSSDGESSTGPHVGEGHSGLPQSKLPGSRVESGSGEKGLQAWTLSHGVLLQ